MLSDVMPSAEEIAARHYYVVTCRQMKWLRIELTKQGQTHKKAFAPLGVSSKATIRAGLEAVDASPFRTVFVVEQKTGTVLFALSKNLEYVETAKKKKKPPKEPPPPPPPNCDVECALCVGTGGFCIDWGDGECDCRNYEEEADEPLEVLAP